ncbi:GILT-like protein F37H8.5 [Zerene cesonia]|uniref:GILT-like protein F37H8.5 n=1 Tax=Zerene cesonia TaxID=33412 RepID=UPI0018E4FE5A|nr:GILT-like protein F37H8.5 [Zerene cesonia]
MEARSFLICVLLCGLIGISHGQVRLVNGTIKMQIGTTARCPDAYRFMKHLVPVYEKYKQFLDIEFVPWGRSSRGENGQLSCQFGVSGCWANRFHRCVLHLLDGNQDAAVKFMQCEFSDTFPGFSGSYFCATQVGLRLIEVDNCMATTGDALEGPAEAATVEPLRIINFIPFIVFNGDIDRHISTQARNRLESVICFALAENAATGVTHCKIEM